MRLVPGDLSSFENKVLEQSLKRELKKIVADKEFEQGRGGTDVTFASEEDVIMTNLKSMLEQNEQ